jgi:hypothetical protein
MKFTVTRNDRRAAMLPHTSREGELMVEPGRPESSRLVR